MKKHSLQKHSLHKMISTVAHKLGSKTNSKENWIWVRLGILDPVSNYAYENGPLKIFAAPGERKVFWNGTLVYKDSWGGDGGIGIQHSTPTVLITNLPWADHVEKIYESLISLNNQEVRT